MYRLETLSRLRKRSWGDDLGLSSDSHPVLTGFAPSLVALLFGWQGVLPILVIAATFGILLRVLRLTDRQAPYLFTVMSIIGIPLSLLLVPTKTIPAELLEKLGLPEDIPVHFSVFVLPPLLLMMLAVAAIDGARAGANGLSALGRCIRVAILALPAIALAILTGWDPTGVVAWLITALAAILIALIPWSDRYMLEANCSPRVD